MANTTNYNWETPDDTDLVKDGAAAIRTLGSSVDTTTKALNPSTTLGDIEYRSATANTNTRLPIGTTGQILSVVGGVPSWVANDVGDITEVQAGTGISVASGTGPVPVITNTVATAIDAAGDLLYGTAADTVARLGIGTAGQVLKVNAGATAPEWGAAGGGGMTLLASGTLSGASLDLTSISSSYEHLQLVIRQGVMSNDAGLTLRLNNLTTSIYDAFIAQNTNATAATAAVITNTSFPITNATGQNPINASLVFDVYDYANTTGNKQIKSQITFLNNGGQVCNTTLFGTCRTTNAIDRITLICGSSQTWSSGTYRLFGVK